MKRPNNAIGSKPKKVLLVGDTIVDIYTYCNVVGEALYAKVPEVEELQSNISYGGNSLLASNLLELGGKVTFVSVVGDDEGARYYKRFVHRNLKKIFFVDTTRKTTIKQRWFAGGEALLQFNRVDNHGIDERLEKKVIGVLEREVPKADVVIVMDPQHGFLTKEIIRSLLRLSKKSKKPLHVDVQISHRGSRHLAYRGADTFFLNEKEAKAVLPAFRRGEGEKKALEQIGKKLHARNIVVKLGEKGSTALVGGRYIKTPAHPVTPVDVCGAGDAFLAAFSLCDRESPEEALRVANIWGGLSTTIHGTVPPKIKDLKMRLGASHHARVSALSIK